MLLGGTGVAPRRSLEVGGLVVLASVIACLVILERIAYIFSLEVHCEGSKFTELLQLLRLKVFALLFFFFLF